MSKRRRGVPSVLALGILSWLSTGCVDVFQGAHIQFDLQPAVQPPAAEGTVPPGPGTPPANTYFSFYAIQYVYATDADGNVITDVNGDPVIDASFAAKVKDFEVNRLVDRASPCFIDIEEDRYPGIHSTMEAERIRQDYGITNALTETDKPMQHRIEVLTAERRERVQIDLQNQVKAVTSFSDVLPPGVHPDFQMAGMGTPCVADGGPTDLIPPINCIDDESNEVRLALCEEFWARYPNYYQGNDKTFTLPRNGSWYGAVNGTNPKNGAPFLAGAGFFVDSTLNPRDVDAFIMNWQYKDLDGNGEPDYPAMTPDEEKSPIGHHYMAGEPEYKVREVINITMRNRTITTVRGDVAIYPDLSDDSVQF